MTKKERIIERLKLLNKMRESGEDGERDNAATLMEEIMRKHGITEADLDEEKDEPFWIQVPDGLHYKLFLQMMALAGGQKGCRLRFMHDLSEKDQQMIRRDMRGTIPDNEEYNVIGFARRSVFAEGLAGYMMYKHDFGKNLDRFFYAYLHRNDLLLKESGKREVKEDEMEDIMASLMMARNIKRAEVFHQLEGGAQ